jgi:hypothetical protein
MVSSFLSVYAVISVQAFQPRPAKQGLWLFFIFLENVCRASKLRRTAKALFPPAGTVPLPCVSGAGARQR